MVENPLADVVETGSLEDVSSDYIPSLNINLTGFERGSLDE